MNISVYETGVNTVKFILQSKENKEHVITSDEDKENKQK